MENLILLLTSSFLFRAAEKKAALTTVSSCGYTALLPAKPVTKRLEDEHGNKVYVGQTNEDGVTYGFATVELDRILNSRCKAEQALFLFMEDMHASFGIAFTTGLQHGYSHPHSDAVWGMTDYWQDTQGIDWKVKGWTDGRVMTVLYIKDLANAGMAQQEAFLNSFQFNPSQKLVQ